MSRNIVIRSLSWTESGVICWDTLCRVWCANWLPFRTNLASSIRSNFWFISWASKSLAASMIIIESLIWLASDTLARCLIKVGIILLLANFTLRKWINIGKLPLTILALSSFEINNLPNITKDTLLPSQIKHSPGTIKTVLIKVNRKWHLNRTCC